MSSSGRSSTALSLKSVSLQGFSEVHLLGSAGFLHERARVEERAGEKDKVKLVNNCVCVCFSEKDGGEERNNCWIVFYRAFPRRFGCRFINLKARCMPSLRIFWGETTQQEEKSSHTWLFPLPTFSHFISISFFSLILALRHSPFLFLSRTVFSCNKTSGCEHLTENRVHKKYSDLDRFHKFSVRFMELLFTRQIVSLKLL